MERIAMGQEERDKLEWLKRAKDKVISQRKAAERMGVSDRWVRKLLQRMKRQGDGAVGVRSLLIVSNHVTLYDVPILLYGLGRRTRRRVAVAMAGEMLLNWRHARGQGNWILNLLSPGAYYLVTALFNVFPLPQSGDFRASFEHAARAMDCGFHVLVFPEGRRTTNGQMQAFQRGSGLLWKELRCDALPVYLDGLWELKTAHAKWFRSDKISTHVGRVITLKPQTDPATATALLEKLVRSLREKC